MTTGGSQCNTANVSLSSPSARSSRSSSYSSDAFEPQRASSATAAVHDGARTGAGAAEEESSASGSENSDTGAPGGNTELADLTAGYGAALANTEARIAALRQPRSTNQQRGSNGTSQEP